MKYRISFVYALEHSNNTYREEFSDLKVARVVLHAISLYTLQLHNDQLVIDYSNVAYIEEFIDGEWQEVDSEDGE